MDVHGVLVRTAHERDLGRIHHIELAAFADSWSLEAFRDLLDHPHARILVAEGAHGELLGYAAAWFVADESEIANLAVDPLARRRGVGGLLLDRILAAGAALGVRSVYLEVRESNAAGIALYASRGFEIAGRRVRYYRMPDEDALLMKRSFRPSGS